MPSTNPQAPQGGAPEANPGKYENLEAVLDTFRPLIEAAFTSGGTDGVTEGAAFALAFGKTLRFPGHLAAAHGVAMRTSVVALKAALAYSEAVFRANCTEPAIGANQEALDRLLALAGDFGKALAPFIHEIEGPVTFVPTVTDAVAAARKEAGL